MDVVEARKPMRVARHGGWYCDDCGVLALGLPSGMVNCRSCGGIGLRGYDNARPRRLTCPDHPTWRGWDDGGVNDDIGRHRREAHVVVPDGGAR